MLGGSPGDTALAWPAGPAPAGRRRLAPVITPHDASRSYYARGGSRPTPSASGDTEAFSRSLEAHG